MPAGGYPLVKARLSVVFGPHADGC